jgi:peptidyl-prolyl cis-trans isomerase SurA
VFRENDVVKVRTITVFYDNPGDPPDPITGARHPGKAEQKRLIDDLRNQVVNGADFGALATTHSHDTAASKGGDRGWVSRDAPGELSDQFVAVALSLKSGQVSEALDVGYGFMLVWVEERQLGKLRPQEEIDSEVNQRVLQQKRRAAEDEWLARLRRNASIKVY